MTGSQAPCSRLIRVVCSKTGAVALGRQRNFYSLDGNLEASVAMR
jgi:hypothetical protein